MQSSVEHQAYSAPAEQKEAEKPARQKYRLRCPYCKKRVRAYRRHVGRKVCCPWCRRPFLIETVGPRNDVPDSVPLSDEEQRNAVRQGKLEQLEGDRQLVELFKHEAALVLEGLALLIGAGLLIYWLSTTGQYVRSDGAVGWTRRREQPPPPVQFALQAGHRLWKLERFHLHDAPHAGALYLVLDGRELRAVVGTLFVSAAEVQRLIGSPAAPRWGSAQLWFRYRAGEDRLLLPELEQQIVSRWSLRQEGRHWVLRRQETLSDRFKIVRVEETVRIAPPSQAEEGTWEMDRRVAVQYHRPGTLRPFRRLHRQARGPVVELSPL